MSVHLERGYPLRPFICLGFEAQMVKNLPAMRETLGREDPVEEGMATHSNILACVPDSHVINDYQPLDHRLISCTISAYSAA